MWIAGNIRAKLECYTFLKSVTTIIRQGVRYEVELRTEVVPTIHCIVRYSLSPLYALKFMETWGITGRTSAYDRPRSNAEYG